MAESACPYAEIIGDPVAHSLSPRLHAFWLNGLGMRGEYRRQRLATNDLSLYLARRRGDPEWRGCNVTAPHKESVIPLLDRLDGSAEQVGAVNCFVPQAEELVGYNSDADGVAEALAGHFHGGRAVVIGAGGAARAAVPALKGLAPCELLILARNPAKADVIQLLVGDTSHIISLSEAGDAIDGASAIVNASPLGSTGGPPIPQALLEALGRAKPGASVLDMVYTPLETPLLRAARSAGLIPIDGLAMLIGQARRAFQLFFGVAPPRDDAALRAELTAPAG